MSKLRILFAVLITFLHTTFAYKDYFEAAEQEHDKYREMHGAGKLVWDAELEDAAHECSKEWFEKYEQTKVLDVSSCSYTDIRHFGINYVLHEGLFTHENPEAMVSVIKKWYDTNKGYNYKNPGNSTGNFQEFTQIVWGASKSLGIDKSFETSNPLKALVVAFYNPKGNIQLPDTSHKWDYFKGNVSHLVTRSGDSNSGSETRFSMYVLGPFLILSQLARRHSQLVLHL